MSSLQTDTFIYRRASQLALAVSLIVLVLFGLMHVIGPESIDVPLRIGVTPAVLALIAAVIAGASQLSLPEKVQNILPAAAQALSILTVATLIHSTGGLFSPYLALWIPAVLFIGGFGATGLLGAAAFPVLYGLWLVLSDALTLQMVLSLIFIGGIPLGLSWLIFSHLTPSEKGRTGNHGQSGQLKHMTDNAEIVITAITNGVIAIDQQGIIQLINPAAQRMIGWDSSDALKLDYKSVLKLEDEESNELTPATDPIRTALSTNEEATADNLRLVTRSGKKLDVSLVASPAGQPGSGSIIVFTDITKEKAEERDQAEFISTASHEMRTPVASIEGYLGLALNPATAQIDDKARLYITKAQEVAQHLGRLFQDLLDITKAEDGRLSNNPRAVEVVTFVKDIVDGLRPQAEAKGLILLYKPVPDDEPDDKSNRRLNPVFYANVDNDHLREVVSNLIENAIKYTKQGSVAVDISGDEKQVQISVQDTGIGIPGEDLPHLFQKFYRVDNTDTREIGGTGLGLYLSRRLAEAMEGHIRAESQQGQGSTFTVSIPRISHQEAMTLIETIDETAAAPQQAVTSAVAAPPLMSQPLAEQPLSQPVAPTIQNTAKVTNGVFASPSAAEIASQLNGSAVPEPLPQAQTDPSLQPNNNVPQRPSLEMIEQNPERYLRRPVDPRNQNQA